MIRNRLCLPGLLAAILLAASGCSREHKVAMNEQVEGTVKLDGKPLANVVVQFVPTGDPMVQAPQSNAYTDAAGHFSLTCDNKKSGAVLGTHTVLVFPGRSAGRTDDMDAVPDRSAPTTATVPSFYAQAVSTPLLIDVSADKHVYDLSLSVSAAPRR